MVLLNATTMQATAKVVYYGPGLCGKTTNLLHIHRRTDQGIRGEMLSLETQGDRTLFFDLLPLEVGLIGGMRVRLQLYTVPGQVFYNATRKLVLKGADGLVFVADSQRQMREANLESLRNLRANLAELGMRLEDLPLVFQYNKRDLRDVLSVEELEVDLNLRGAPYFESAALQGTGVIETLRGISRLALASIRPRLVEAGGRRASAGLPAPGPSPAPTPAKPNHPPREKTVELRAQVGVPASVLSGGSQLALHLSVNGKEVEIADVVTLRLEDKPLDRLSLRLDLEVTGTED